MKKSIARHLAVAEVAASDAARAMVSRIPTLDADQLREARGGNAVTRQRYKVS
jgi:hypothetical protein